jgi:hypothetical protein
MSRHGVWLLLGLGLLDGVELGEFFGLRETLELDGWGELPALPLPAAVLVLAPPGVGDVPGRNAATTTTWLPGLTGPFGVTLVTVPFAAFPFAAHCSSG